MESKETLGKMTPVHRVERSDGWVFGYDVNRVDAEAALDLALGVPRAVVAPDGALGWLRRPDAPVVWWVPSSRYLDRGYQPPRVMGEGWRLDE
jgi:hypothetical protein